MPATTQDPKRNAAAEKAKILSAVESFSTVMLGTHSVDNRVEFRPMAVAGRREESFYFITAKHSGKVSDVEQTGLITVIAQSDSAFLSLSGQGEAEQDHQLLKEFWNPSFQAWFPGGPDDPEVSLLRFTPIEGELWDQTLATKANYVWEVISSNLTGKKAEMDESYHSF